MPYFFLLLVMFALLPSFLFAETKFLVAEKPLLFDSPDLEGASREVPFGCKVTVLRQQMGKKFVACGEVRGWTRALFLSPTSPQANRIQFSDTDFQIEKVNRSRARLGDSPLTMASRGFSDSSGSSSAKERTASQAEEDLEWLEAQR